jgi:radical SAM superfamily enzyme YgiQ (UPF0313 family)
MRIYLAELFHTFVAANRETSPYTVPLGIGFLAATIRQRLPEVEVELFRDPDQLIEAIRRRPPAVLGLSVCNWNIDLSRRMTQYVRTAVPGIITVAGGPSVDDQDGAIVDFFGDFPGLDYLIPSEGENGIVALLTHLANGGDRGGAVVPGVAYLDPAGALVRGPYSMPILTKATPVVSEEGDQGSAEYVDEIPSPYLTGLLDPFLAQGLTPILQTMRGCPYRCEFCVSGTAVWNRPRGFSLDRVKAEIDYIGKRSQTGDLLLTDENWGLLGDRDIEVARHLVERSRSANWPGRVYYYTAKIVTDASRTVVETIKPIAWGAEMMMSFQSLNPATRKAIRRTNISLEKVAANVQWANERDIKTESEMIYGFPHETPETFCDGVETLLAHGMNSVVVYPLQLFGGIDLATRERREAFGIKTKFRFAEGSFGIYAGGEIVAVENEEVVVGTNWSSFDDYLRIRRYGFFLQLLLVREFFREFFKLCQPAGIVAAPLVRHLAFADYTRYPALAAILAEYNADAQHELHDTSDDLYHVFSAKLERGERIEGVKLNLVYIAKITSSRAAVDELLSVVEDYVRQTATNVEHQRVLASYLREVLANRVVILHREVESTIEFESSFDYGRWTTGRFTDLGELLLETARRYRGQAHDQLLGNLGTFDRASTASLQAAIDHTAPKHLLRSVGPVTAPRPSLGAQPGRLPRGAARDLSTTAPSTP